MGANKRWEVARCWAGKGVPEDEEKLERLLNEGYKPFSVTSNGQAGYTYHLRRKITKYKYGDVV